MADESGQALLLVVLFVPVLIAAAAFVIDIGDISVAHHRAQQAADAAALAGAQDLEQGAATTTTASATVTTDSQTYAHDNDPDASSQTTVGYNNQPTAVKVVVTATIPLPFGAMFGLGSGTVTASAVANADLTTPLGYFQGDADGDLQDGSEVGDGWDNFCSPDNVSYTNEYDGSVGTADDPERCPSSAAAVNGSLDGWDVVHGGVDVGTSDQFYSPPNTTDQMVDLTGTCVETEGDWPASSGEPSGYSTILNDDGGSGDFPGEYDGFCENNADGELAQQVNVTPGQQYTVNFWLGANTGGFPAEKALMLFVSTTNPADLPAVADTNGYNNESGAEPYGTSYPLEKGSDWTNGDVLAWREYFDWNPDTPAGDWTSGAPDPNWGYESLTFTAPSGASSVYVAFGALTNCAPDWTASSALSNGEDNEFYPVGSNDTASTNSSFVEPPDNVLAADSAAAWQNVCYFGPGLSDITVTRNSSVALTQ